MTGAHWAPPKPTGDHEAAAHPHGVKVGVAPRVLPVLPHAPKAGLVPLAFNSLGEIELESDRSRTSSHPGRGGAGLPTHVPVSTHHATSSTKLFPSPLSPVSTSRRSPSLQIEPGSRPVLIFSDRGVRAFPAASPGASRVPHLTPRQLPVLWSACDRPLPPRARRALASHDPDPAPAPSSRRSSPAPAPASRTPRPSSPSASPARWSSAPPACAGSSARARAG